MAYTTPSTVSGSDVLTAALWNTQIRDNLETLRKPTMAIACLGGGTMIAQNTNTALQLSVVSDPYSMVTTGATSATYASAGKITVPTAGIYRVSYHFIDAAVASVNGISYAGVIKNGVGSIDNVSSPTCFFISIGYAYNSTTVFFTHSSSGLMVLAANDYLQLTMNTSRAPGTNFYNGANRSNFSVELIGTI